jgi:hypothetical protein
LTYKRQYGIVVVGNEKEETKMKFDNVIFSNGATKATSETILKNINLGYREKAILADLAEIRQNSEVPEGDIIYEFCSKNGDGFEAGKTRLGYSITN